MTSGIPLGVHDKGQPLGKKGEEKVHLDRNGTPQILRLVSGPSGVTQ